MSQLLFWDGKGHDPDGWIYKTEKEMERETGLTRSSQRKARRVLVRKGVLEEDKRCLPRRLHYRADLRALMVTLSGEASTGQKVHASEEGNSRLTGEEDSTFLTGEETITSPTSEEATNFPTSEEGSTDPAYTESTSETTTERLQRVEAGELALQGSVNMTKPFPGKPKGMHLKTYLRLRAKYEKAHEEYSREMVAHLERLTEGMD